MRGTTGAKKFNTKHMELTIILGIMFLALAAHNIYLQKKMNLMRDAVVALIHRVYDVEDGEIQ